MEEFRANEMDHWVRMWMHEWIRKKKKKRSYSMFINAEKELKFIKCSY